MRSHGAKCSCLYAPPSTDSGSAQKSSSSSGRRLAVEPVYENLDFHRVKISIPGGSGRPYLLNDAGSGSHRAGCGLKAGSAHSVNTRIVRSQRVRARPPRGATIGPASGALQGRSVAEMSEKDRKTFEKFGYSKHEVWNWLYTDNEEELLEQQQQQAGDCDKRLRETIPVPDEFRDLYSVPNKTSSAAAKAKDENDNEISADASEDEEDVEDAEEEEHFEEYEQDEPKIEVRFSPQEFFGASSRLAHLDLDGLDTFVGNTLEKAIAKKQKERNERIRQERAQATAQEREPVGGAACKPVSREDHTVTITEVPQHSPLDVRTEYVPMSACHHLQPAKGPGRLSVKQDGRVPCQTCLASGESSCSSALSSLESVRSNGLRSVTGGSSAGCSETLGSELHPAMTGVAQGREGKVPAKPQRVNLSRTVNGASGNRERLAGVSKPRDQSPALYMDIGEDRSDVAGSRSSTLTGSHKPYQTLEVQNQDGILESHNGKDEMRFVQLNE